MREIKFRAWYPSVKKMRFFSDGEIIADSSDRVGMFFPCNESVFLSSCEVMQYTGLRDKDGMEIYLDSDIVVLQVWHGGEQPSVCPITHDVIDGKEPKLSIHKGIITEGEFGTFKINDFYLINLSDADNYEFEVIGNIYENPELLEGVR